MIRAVFNWTIALSLLFLSCGAGCKPTSEVKSDNRPVVYVSFYPLYDFAQKIGGDKIQLFSLIRPGIQAHQWDPSPRDLAGLSKADVFICNGLGMEPWMQNAVKAVNNPHLTLVEAAQGVETLTGGCCHHHEAHEKHEEHGEHDAHDAHDEIETVASEIDPHIWLSPENAKIMMKNIADALVKADSSNKNYYLQNYERWAFACDQLDKKFHQALDSAPKKDIVVSHQAFGYLCHAFGLNQIAIEGITESSDPGPARMAEIVSEIKRYNVKVIFMESSSDSRVADALARETKTRVDVLNPYETLYESEIDAGEDYFSIMNKNLESLKKALNE